MNARRWWGAGLLVLVVAAGGWWLRQSPPDAGAEEAAGRSGVDAARQVRAALPADAFAPRYVPPQLRAALGPDADDWLAPLPEVIDVLEARAAGGDADAAHVLGARLSACRLTLQRDAPETLLAEQEAEDSGPTVQLGAPAAAGQRDVAKDTMRRQWADRLQQYEACAAIDARRMAEGLAWLQRAGEAGLVKAQLSYAQHALAGFEGDPGALVADIEEAVRRRDRAAAWLRPLIEGGNEAALRVVIDTPALAGVVGDPAALASYRYVISLLGGRRTSQFDALWAQGPKRYGDEFSQAEWDAIATRGREIFREDFADAPLWPNR